MELQHDYVDHENTLKFTILVEKLLTLTQTSVINKEILIDNLKNINKLNFKQINIHNKNAMTLVIQMCSIIQPNETSLVAEYSKFLNNLMKQAVVSQARIFINCKQWIMKSLEFSDPSCALNVLSALELILITNTFFNAEQDLEKLLKDNSLLLKYLYPLNKKWNEEQFLALSCLLAMLCTEKKDGINYSELFSIIKTIVLKTLYNIPYGSLDNSYFNKTIITGVKILRKIITEKSILNITDFLGEMLGLVQAYLFHGIEGYVNIIPQQLRPSAMNLPEIIYPVQTKKYFRNHKSKIKRQSCKKISTESKKNLPLEIKENYKYSSDSETSDTENKNTLLQESTVRLETMYLLNALVESSSNRDFFGYWTQIVSNGSKFDTRVLTKYILKEPLPKIRQLGLSTLNDLLLGARVFLTHAEDTEQMSFITFFGMLSFVIREMHFTISLLLSSERNVVVLTQTLKCAAALAQATPYSRLKPGLATKLIRHCRNHLVHKDPTVRVAALSVFEILALSEPITSEIYSILAKSSNVDIYTEFSTLDINNTNESDTEEIVLDDFDEIIQETDIEKDYSNEQTNVSSLVQICFKNVSNETVNEPVRLQSLKLLGTLAFNTSSLIFSHLEVITKSLIDLINEQDAQVAFHACRVLETMAGRLSDSKSENTSKFWNIVFNPIISLVQNSQTNLREVACDCLGNIGGDMLALLSREKNIMIITVLFGAVHDDESAVRAASLRTLGLLVTLPILEEDAGFLMDLIDLTCSSSEDRNLGVRIKAAWTMASLCDCLIKRECRDDLEPIPLELALPKLYKMSIKGGQDHEKVKCNAVRAIGNIISLSKDESILQDTSCGLDILISCATTGNDMKVRWNACRAIGTILSHNPNSILPLNWKDRVFPSLSDLVCNSPNFKVRTNAAWAISVCNSYDKYIITLWSSIIMALENSQHVPSYIEYPHRDALVQQLCLTLCHLAIHTDISILEPLWEEIKDHFDDLFHQIKQFQEHILPEKAGDLVKAKGRFILFSQQASKTTERLIAKKLVELFKREERYDYADSVPNLN